MTSAADAPNRRLVWIDMEMTGLDPDQDHILEIASVVTGPELDVLAEGPAFPVYQPDKILQLMDAWNKRTHGASGLIDRVRKSRFSVAAAEHLTLQFLRQWVHPNSSPICGNSVGQDRRFIHRYMPALNEFLHYRVIDVSSVKELAMRWRPDLPAGFAKQNQHRALADIKESIAELRYYRDRFFVHSRPDETADTTEE